MKPSAYTLDDTRFPLVTGRASRHVGEEAALGETYLALEALLARRQRMVLLLDLRGSVSSPGRRKRFADWMSSHEPAIQRYVIALAVVVGSELERGVVTAVAWLKAPPVELRVFTGPLEAETWLRSRLAAR